MFSYNLQLSHVDSITSLWKRHLVWQSTKYQHRSWYKDESECLIKVPEWNALVDSYREIPNNEFETQVIDFIDNLYNFQSTYSINYQQADWIPVISFILQTGINTAIQTMDKKLIDALDPLVKSWQSLMVVILTFPDNSDAWMFPFLYQ